MIRHNSPHDHSHQAFEPGGPVHQGAHRRALAAHAVGVLRQVWCTIDALAEQTPRCHSRLLPGEGNLPTTDRVDLYVAQAPYDATTIDETGRVGSIVGMSGAQALDTVIRGHHDLQPPVLAVGTGLGHLVRHIRHHHALAGVDHDDRASPTAPAVGMAEAKRMWIGFGARGLGLGRRLLGELEVQAVQHGAHLLRLETNRNLAEAIAMYRSSGFREVDAFNDEAYADFWFEKRLPAPPVTPR